VQPDPEAAVRFYGGLFGWEFEDRMPADAPGSYFVARLDGQDVAAVGSQQQPGAAAWNTYIWVENADDAAVRVKDAGGSVLTEGFDVLDAGRMAVLADPAGAAFCVWQAGRHRGAQVVNAPGTWNWSDLHTSDAEGAKAFYGTVFGWEPATIDLGPGGSATMWRVPGYGDALAERYPEIRTLHAQPGIPEGFSDAIGWLIAADGPPRWNVTFAAGDTDAAAGRASELGGTVVMPPADLGPSRMAVLSDPAGATFTVSTYSG
jgi:uncharacterized protein